MIEEGNPEGLSNLSKSTQLVRGQPGVKPRSWTLESGYLFPVLNGFTQLGAYKKYIIPN